MHYEKQVQKYNTEHGTGGRFAEGSGGSSSSSSSTKPAAPTNPAKPFSDPASIKKIAKAADDLNKQANEIRRGGDAPYFSNVVHAFFNGKDHDITYEGPFIYQQSGGGATHTDFRADQIDEIQLSS